MSVEKVEFRGHNGDMLAGRLDMPVGKPRACALFAHCFTCSKDIAAARRISGALAGLGIAVLRFDFTGLGHSEGEFANTGFSSNVDDLIAAADFMREKIQAPSLLIGHSLGGAAVIAAAARIPESKAVVTVGAPADPAHVLNNFADRVEEIKSKGKAEVELAGRKFTISSDFVEDVSSANLATALAGLRRALLVMHAPGDTTVSIDDAGTIFKAAKHPKSFVTLDGADHLLTNEEDATYAAETIATWAKRYLDLPQPAFDKKVPEGITRVSEADPAGFLQDVSVSGSFHLLADEPERVGGTNLGPSPYQFLAIALGACTSMTLRMYARRKKLALASVSVDVTHNKQHAPDCDECESSKAKIDVLERIITIEGELDDQQRQRLLQIADMCPVHKTLESEVLIKTRYSD